MGLHYESLPLGSVRAEQISGRQGVGASELRFSLAWNIAPKRQHIISVPGIVMTPEVVADARSALERIGNARRECEKTRELHR